MSASQVLDLAERKGLLDAKVIIDLRRQVAESKFVVTPEAIAKILVDHGHLTPFQARKLVSEALEGNEPAPESPAAPAPTPAAAAPTPSPKPAVPPAKPSTAAEDDLLAQLADEEPPTRSIPAPPAAAEEDIVELALGDEEVPSLLSPPAKPLLPGSSAVGQPPRRPVPAKDDEEIVDLELALPSASASPVAPNKPTGSKSGGNKGTSKPAAVPPAAPAKPKAPPSPPVQVAATPLTPLTPIAPTPLTPVSAPVDLFGGPSLTPLSPLGGGDLMGANPFGAPAATPEADGKKGKGKKGPKKNKWDSPLLLLGGGGLGLMLIIAAFLFYSLTRGNAAEEFKQAEAEYNAGSLASAMDKLDHFIKANPSGPNSSMARVLRGMAELRSNSEEGRNPAKGLKAAQEILPRIKEEEAFPDVRLWLRPILSDIARGYSDLALKTDDSKRRLELVKLTEDALALVRNPEYIPSSLLVDIQAQVNATEDKLRAARRSIDQDVDRANSLAKMDALITAGTLNEAYEERRALLRKYPNLESDTELLAKTMQASESERAAVKRTEENHAPIATAATPSLGTRTVLGIRTGGKIAGRAGKVVVVSLLGAAYGVNLEDGSIIWRRYLGNSSKQTPVPVAREVGSDVLVSDDRSHELIRLQAATGTPAWRLQMPEPYALPIVVGDHAFVTLASGMIWEVNLASGLCARQVQVPQRLSLPCGADATSRTPRLIQVGDHSTVFSLQVETLECMSTAYLGHRTGTIKVPPVAVLGNVLVAESRTEEFSEIHVLVPSPENKKQLVVHAETFRLKGRIVSPMVVSGRRAVIVSDLGHVLLLEADTGSVEKPFRVVGEVEAAETTPVYPYAQMDGSRLWVYSQRSTGFEIQSTQEKIGRKWTANKDDTFVAPPILLEDCIVHVRKRAGTSGHTIEASALEDGNKVLWAVDLGTNLVQVGANEAAKQFVAINSRGQVFEFPNEAFSNGFSDKVAFQPIGSIDQWLLSDGSVVDGESWCASGITNSGRAIVYRKGSAADRIKQVELAIPPKEAVGGVASFDGGLLVPLRMGQVLHLDAVTGAPKLFPFQPELAAGKKINWLRPAVFKDRREFIISDGESTLFRIGVKEQPRPFLASLKEASLPGKVVGPLAAAEGDTVAALTREDAQWRLVLVDSKELQVKATKVLTAPPSWGPVAVGSSIAMVDPTRGLVVFDSDGSELWACDLAGDTLVGEPIVQDANWIVTTRNGKILRIQSTDGTLLGQADCGEPLLGVRYLLGERLMLSGIDGTVMLVPLPAKK